MSARTSSVDLRFWARGEALAGQIAVADLHRLRHEVAKADGSLRYEVVPTRVDGKPAVEISLLGRVWLTCQRCLGDFESDLAVRRVLVFAPPPPAIDEEGDATDFVGTDAFFEAPALVEEEALLSLPMVPRHPVGECPAEQGGAQFVCGAGGGEDLGSTRKH